MAEPSPTTPAAAAAPVTQQSVTQLVTGILDDAQRLAKQQIEMLKSEFHEDIRRTKRALEFSSLGIVTLTIGGMSLVFGLVWLLHEQWQFSMWGSWLIIGGLFTAVGITLSVVGRNLFESFNPLPDKTFNALQENLTWKTSPQT